MKTPRRHDAPAHWAPRALTALPLALSLSACGGESRLPRQTEAPAVAVVAPVIPEPRPAPPRPPPPPPPTDGAELFAQADWHPRSLERVCEAVEGAVRTTHREIVRDATDAEALADRLDALAERVEVTLALAAQLVEVAPAELAGTARACQALIGQAKAELFASPHLYRALQKHAGSPRLRPLRALLERAGAALPDAPRAKLASLLQEAHRLQQVLAEDGVGEAPRAAFQGLPHFLEDREADPLTLSRDDLAIGLALLPDATALTLLEASVEARDVGRREPLIELLRARQKIAALLGHPTWAAYVTAAHNQTPAEVDAQLEALRVAAAPFAEREREALGPLDEGLDRALAAARADGAPPQTAVGPWPYRQVRRPAVASWTDALRPPSAAPWGTELAPQVTPAPTPARAHARAIGLSRQAQLASFWLAAHGLPDATAEQLDALWADTLARFGLAELYPPAAWPAFDGLVSSPGYHLVLDALLGPTRGQALERWLAEHAAEAPTPPTE